MRSLGALALALTLAAAPAAAQAGPDSAPSAAVSAAAPASHAAASEAEREAAARQAAEERIDIITPHITDSRHLEVPYWKAPFYREVTLPQWEPLHIGGLTLDLSPTKHVVFLLLAAVLTAVVLIGSARAHVRHSHQLGRPRGFAAGMEAMVLYLREDVVLRNIPHGGARYAPFILTLFFFILFANLLGLIPYGSTATGNVSVTATLAIITLVVVEVSGMLALGPGYLKTIIYWPSDMSLAVKLPMTLIMTPIEIVGKLTKPFALTIRLFANMTAGHIVVLALIGLIFAFAGFASTAPLLMAVAIMLLEIFVAFLQAYIFALLSAVFIGLMLESHH
ncbi:MAG TPA: F0F1 ATP synthase subunit A [Gemmatimonadaceae bacterium]|nr:F0F1 ATP synthase subunit A [Gemmatimonadaceae bacterium]